MNTFEKGSGLVTISKGTEPVLTRRAELDFTDFVHQEKLSNPLSLNGFVLWAGALTSNPPDRLKCYESNTDSAEGYPLPLTPPGVLLYGYMLIKFPFPGRYVVLSLVFDGPEDARIDFYDRDGLMFETVQVASGKPYWPVTRVLRPGGETAMIGIAHRIETAVCRLRLCETPPG